jgi:hypothetical protein
MTISPDVQAYMEKWVQTATNGQVNIEWAWFQARLALRCHFCGASYKCSAPVTVEMIEYDIQSFVNKHSPNGVHDKEDKSLKNPMDPIPLTADFKKVGPVYDNWLGESQSKIDASVTKANILQDQMKKYKAEQEKIDLEEKAAWLQKTGGGIANALKQQDLNDKDAKDVALALLLKVMEVAGWNNLPAKHSLPIQVTPAPPQPRRRAAKIISGRRFR